MRNSKVQGWVKRQAGVGHLASILGAKFLYLFWGSSVKHIILPPRVLNSPCEAVCMEEDVGDFTCYIRSRFLAEVLLTGSGSSSIEE